MGFRYLLRLSCTHFFMTKCISANTNTKKASLYFAHFSFTIQRHIRESRNFLIHYICFYFLFFIPSFEFSHGRVSLILFHLSNWNSAQRSLHHFTICYPFIQRIISNICKILIWKGLDFSKLSLRTIMLNNNQKFPSHS